MLKRNENALLIKSSNSDFQLGMWIHEILHFIEDVHFMPERIKTENQINIPDKAILCSCVAYESYNTESDLDLIFSLTHGYTSSYQRKDDFSNDLYSPFKNIYWYATQEGMGQYIQLTDSAKDSFFYDLAFNRMTNYCYLLVLVLQQYYSLLNYSKRISALPDDKSYISTEQYHDMLVLTDELNEFFLRNTFPQISHISHQNGVYQYLREVYKINDFFEQVKNGLDAVVERAKMFRSEKHEDNIKLFTIIGAFLGVSGVVCNASDLISFVLGKESADESWFMALLTVLIGSVLLGFSVWIIWYLSKYKKRK